MSFLLLLFYVTNVIIKALKQRLHNAEPKNAYGSITMCHLQACLFFTRLLFYPTGIALSILGNLYIAAFNLPCRRRGVIHLFWLVDPQRESPFFQKEKGEGETPLIISIWLCVGLS